MRITNEMRMTVAFVCIRLANGTTQPRGTAFFIGETRQYKVKMYVVTAKHVLEGIRRKTALDRVLVTFNGPEGRQEEEILLSDWHYHPDSDKEYVDVAVARFRHDHVPNRTPRLSSQDELRFWPTNLFLPNVQSSAKEIWRGLEVGIAGLFVHHTGKLKNIPIVRCGNIAAMPTEPVETTAGPLNAFLIEIRSIGGLSGSPVFTVVGNSRIILIGLIHGHFNKELEQPDLVEDAAAGHADEQINVGIAIVIPAEKIRETLAPLLTSDFTESFRLLPAESQTL